jgi:hypothetical protein
MVLPTDNPAHFSDRWACVIQFQSDTAVERGHLTGRVEHVISGQATDFQSLETLLPPVGIGYIPIERRTR